LREGVVAILDLGDKDSISSNYIKKLAEFHQIPYIWSYWDRYTKFNYTTYFEYSLNTYPDWGEVSKALIDLINSTKWDSFILIYEENDSENMFYLNNFEAIEFKYLFLSF
jgi:hypothetical protein